jgi:hypothetical protein
MEGIMNLPANVGGATSQDGLDSFAPLIAAQQAAQDMGYPRFTRELLSAGAEMDQAEVQEFLQTIRDAGLTSEDVALMRRVVEAVFGDPNNYPEVRARLLAEGVPEDILPETFDLEFFVALRMAVEEAENLSQEPRPTGQEMPMDMPVGMAEGGIVGLPQMTPIAREMAAMGRNGDTMLAHITPQEAMMLQRMGGSGTINPYTGLPEFFLKKLFKGIGKAIKSVGKAVKKFAKSTVGRIVLSVALGAFLGPMATGFLSGMGVTVGAAAATGISAGIGVFGSSLLAGDGFKNSLRNGLTAGALTYGTAGLMGGFSTPAAGAPQTLGEGFTKGLDNITSPFRKAADFIRGGPEAPITPAGPVGDAATQLAKSPADRFPMFEGDGTYVAKGIKDSVTVNELLPQSLPLPENLDVLNYGDIPADSVRQPLYPPANPFSSPASLTRGAPTPQVNTISPQVNTISPQVNTQFERAVAQGQVKPSDFASLAEPPGLVDRVTQGAKDVYTDYLSPSRTSIQGRSADTIFKDLTLPKDQGGQFGFTSTPETLKLATEMAAKEAPGTFAKYGPIAAVAGTTLAATGGLDSLMKVPLPEGMTQEEFDAKIAQDQAQFRQDRPAFYGSFTRPEYYLPPTYRAAEGSGPEGVENFPRKNGAINGPGTGTSDDIPAMLSDGEFVFTAKSVRNMGGGSRRKGAAKMYKLMKMLEGGPVSKTAGA